MNLRYRPLLLGAAAIGVGAVLVLMLPRKPTVPAPARETLDMAAADVTAAADGAAQMAAKVQIESFPWEQGRPTERTAAATSNSTMPRAMPAAALADMSLTAVRQQLGQSQQATDDLLQKIDRMEASGQVPKEVDLGALRTNVAIAKRAQILTLELLALNQQPDSDARANRAQQIVAELQQLQANLRTDVAAGHAPSGR